MTSYFVSMICIALYVVPIAVSFMLNRYSKPDSTGDQTFILRRNRLFLKLGFGVAVLGLLIGVAAELHPDMNTNVIVWGVIVLIFGIMIMLLSTNVIEVRWNVDGIVGPEFDTPAGLVMRHMAFDDIVEFKRLGWRSLLKSRQNYRVTNEDGHKIFWGYSLKGYTALNDEIARLRPDLV